LVRPIKNFKKATTEPDEIDITPEKVCGEKKEEKVRIQEIMTFSVVRGNEE